MYSAFQFNCWRLNIGKCTSTHLFFINVYTCSLSNIVQNEKSNLEVIKFKTEMIMDLQQ